MSDASIHDQNRELLAPLRAAMYDFDRKKISELIGSLFAADALMQLSHPFETLDGPQAFLEDALLPLQQAVPDLERRDYIVVAGAGESGDNWVGCAGYYTGAFMVPFLGIPPTGHHIGMRFHEFYRIADGKVVELQGIWDLPELMMQAGVWPLGPGLGRNWHVPAPATQDGMPLTPRDEKRSAASARLVLDMLAGLAKFAEGGAKAMRLEEYWHPKFSWYGPAGIGTTRGVAGFRNWHQIPFLNALPDRRGSAYGGSHLFGDSDYVGATGWPNMEMTVSGGGLMGIAPAGQKITMRSLDFWRCENGLIRENWVLIDLLHVHHQLGVDILSRMSELAKANPLGPSRHLFEESPGD